MSSLRTNILVVMSGAYCNAELQVEFGRIPAAYVPVGASRIIDQQAKLIPAENLYVVVPSGFVDPGRQTIQVSSLLPIDQAFPIAASRLIDLIEQKDPNTLIHFLWGDTLVTELADEPCVGVTALADPGFSWQYIGTDAFAGYLCVSADRLELDLSRLINQLPVRHLTSENWLDFGHGATYWKSRTKFFKTRSFNSLQAKQNALIKKSSTERTNAELFWYANIPEALRFYTPRTMRCSNDSYMVELCPYPSLAEIWVYGSKSTDWWTGIIGQVLDFVALAQEHEPASNHRTIADPLLIDKSIRRIEASPFSSPTSLVQSVIRHLRGLDIKPHVMHGDLCFSNILYDSRLDCISVIDPRGADSNGEPTIYGCALYDLAKLAHSLIGHYDFIVFGLERPEPNVWLEGEFYRMVEQRFGYKKIDIQCAMVLLFLSMVPLHMDDPARALKLHNRGTQILRDIIWNS